MADDLVKKCPQCGQLLRFPDKIGGMLMACPSCGNKFQSDFKLCSTGKNVHQNILITIFDMPYKIFRYICRYFGSIV